MQCKHIHVQYHAIFKFIKFVNTINNSLLYATDHTNHVLFDTRGNFHYEKVDTKMNYIGAIFLLFFFNLNSLIALSKFIFFAVEC